VIALLFVSRIGFSLAKDDPTLAGASHARLKLVVPAPLEILILRFFFLRLCWHIASLPRGENAHYRLKRSGGAASGKRFRSPARFAGLCVAGRKSALENPRPLGQEKANPFRRRLTLTHGGYRRAMAPCAGGPYLQLFRDYGS